MIPDITYLILNYNPYGDSQAEGILKQTIDSFYARKSKSLSADVYLLDQGTTDTHRSFIIEQQKYKLNLILFRKNIGIAGAINFIVSSSKSPVIGLITSDIIFTTGIDEDLYNKVQIPEVYQAVPLTDKSDLIYQTMLPEEEYGSDNVKTPGKPGEYIRCIGSELNVMFWRKSIFDRVGFYDERWKAGYENIDFSMRCFLDGGCTAVSKNSFVWHFHKMTHKNKANERSYEGYTEVKDWQAYARRLWDDKWPMLNKFIDIYKLLEEKDIGDFPDLYETFHENIFLPYA